ncbi:hypothetical protein Bbelb_310930 [Branchiostoma belcheri]|nr:hypothetical protein Bbelb_310930 [Branchiostoma belcheri]
MSISSGERDFYGNPDVVEFVSSSTQRYKSVLVRVSKRRKKSSTFESRRRKWRMDELCSKQTANQTHIKQEDTGDKEHEVLVEEAYSVKLPTGYLGYLTHIKEEKTEDTEWQLDIEDVNKTQTKDIKDTGWQPDKQEDMQRQQAYSEKQETHLPTWYPVNNTYNIGEQAADTSVVECPRSDKEVLPQTTVQSSTVQGDSHMAEHTFICWKCGYRAAERSLMYKHMTQHTGEKPYKCDQCDYSAEQKSQVDQHVMANHTGDKSYMCGDCGYRTAFSAVMLSCHATSGLKRTHTGEKVTGEQLSFKCDHCDFSAPGRRDRDQHVMQKHTGEKPYMCGECGYRTAVKSHLSRHMKIHTGEKPYKCDQCDYSAAQKYQVDQHVTRKHTGEKPYVCEDCGYRTAQSSNLYLHRRKHTGEKPYKCDQCDYSAARKHHLDQHLAKHTGEKPYMCSVCGLRMADSGNLSRHMKTHTGEKPYKCDQCDYSAAKKRLLDEHVMTKHTGEKPYICVECGYRTAGSAAFSRHKRTHTGEKSYMCEECGFRTATSWNLSQHKKTHTGERPYKCDQCDYSAAQKGNLDQHVIAKHITVKPYMSVDFR